jgi:DNA polymerase III epsilon subunit-like protein
MFPLKLDRPLIVFDIEATGTSPRADRIVELAAIRLEPDGSEVSGYWLLNPASHPHRDHRHHDASRTRSSAPAPPSRTRRSRS